MRSQAAKALGTIGSAAKPAIPDLIKVLGDKDRSVLLAAVRALGLIGPDARAAVPDLVKAMDDKDSFLRAEAAFALARIGPQAAAALSKLSDRMKNDSNKWVREMAAVAMCGIAGAEAKEAIAFLKQVVNTEESFYSDPAKRALAEVEGKNRP